MPADAVILNADDLALCAPVTQGVLAAWHAHAVSDASVFATSDTLVDALRAAQAAGLPVGVHLNLTFGRPVSDAGEVPALVGASRPEQAGPGALAECAFTLSVRRA